MWSVCQPAAVSAASTCHRCSRHRRQSCEPAAVVTPEWQDQVHAERSYPATCCRAATAPSDSGCTYAQTATADHRMIRCDTRPCAHQHNHMLSVYMTALDWQQKVHPACRKAASQISNVCFWEKLAECGVNVMPDKQNEGTRENIHHKFVRQYKSNVNQRCSITSHVRVLSTCNYEEFNHTFNAGVLCHWLLCNRRVDMQLKHTAEGFWNSKSHNWGTVASCWLTWEVTVMVTRLWWGSNAGTPSIWQQSCTEPCGLDSSLFHPLLGFWWKGHCTQGARVV